MITWGGSATSKGDLMRMVLWLIVIYEGVIGVAEIANSSMSSTSGGASSALATLESLPSVGSLVGTSGAMTSGIVGSLLGTSGAMTSGIVDLAVAAGIWYFAI